MSNRLVGLIPLVAGCTAGVVPVEPPDCSAPASSLAAWVCEAEAGRVGTGEVDFTPLGAGDPLDLVRGPQGAQHVFAALELPLTEADLLTGRGEVTVALWELDGMATATDEVSSTAALRSSEGGIAATGLLHVVDPPELAVDQDVWLAVGVRPVGEPWYRDTQRVHVTWADSSGQDEALPDALDEPTWQP